MAAEVFMPKISDHMETGEIVEWLVQEGSTVEKGQPILATMTDKATVTIGAPKAGKIAELGGKAGAVIKVGQVLVVIDTAGGASAAASPAAASSASSKAAASAGPAATAVGDIKESLPGSAFFTKKAPPPTAAAAAVVAGNGNGAGHATPAIEYFAEKPLATPATRKLARDMAVDIAGYLARRMARPDGGFFTAEDADIEGKEGETYVWTRAEIERSSAPPRRSNSSGFTR